VVLKILKALFLWITPLGFALAQPSTHLQKGDSAFAARQYRLALQQYQVVEKAGFGSPAMLLKMAYIHEGLSQVAPSLRYLSLYHARTGDPAAEQKIQTLAEKNQLNGYQLTDGEKLRQLVAKQKMSISILLVTLVVALAGLISFQKFRRNQANRAIISLLVVGCLALAWNQYANRPTQYGILNGTTNYLMNGPSAGAGLMSIQKDGHRVKIIGRQDVWLAVVWNSKTVFIRENQLLTLGLIQ